MLSTTIVFAMTLVLTGIAHGVADRGAADLEARDVLFEQGTMGDLIVRDLIEHPPLDGSSDDDA